MSNRKNTAPEPPRRVNSRGCRVCGKDGMSRVEGEHRVHEYCRSYLPDWKLPQEGTR